MENRRGVDGTDEAEIARRLARICGPGFSRPAGAADEVAGAPSRWVAMPPTAEAVGEVLGLAGDRELTVVPRGAGTKIDWGVPPSHVDIVLDTGRLAGVWHRPTGDLAEVGAGTPVRAAQDILREDGLRLPIDVRSPDATIGGVVAADEAGPLRLAHGPSGSRLTAVSYVTASGALARADADTVAPVAGADPVRLFCGSQGAFGVLISATLRVQPRPECRHWVSYPLHTLSELFPLVSTIRDRIDPAAIEVDLPPDGVVHGGRESIGTLAVLLEGAQPEAAERVAELARVTGLAGPAAAEPDWWPRYPFGPGDIALRIEVPIAHLLNAVLAVYDSFRVPLAIRGSASLGVLHVALPGTTDPGLVAGGLAGVRHVLRTREGRCEVVTAPPAVRHRVDVWDAVPHLPLLRRIKDGVDPAGRLAPGRLPGGI